MRILACLIDITTALIPQFLLWNIKMKRTTKLSLDIIFALGLITAGLSIGRVASMNHGVWETDTGWRAMNSDTFSMVEEKCGIIFASGPAIRQFIAYYRRVGTFAPTKKRQRPEEDFVGFRRRVNLRDIFWYRQAPVTNGRVLRPQQMFHPPTSDVSSANQSLGEKDVKIADKKAQRSMLDRLTGRAKRDGSPTDSNVSSNMSSGKTKLWNWSMRSTEHSGDRTESSDSGGERIWPGQDKSVRVDQEYGYDVEATPRTILPTDDVPYIESLANPSMEQRRLQITRNLQG
ncbi:MAG: hypothetical protein M1821_002691 [Bathelium mastoideum]|nr:MAG: hypothetical protein M1821_002691 [Bathelium mastoideum]